MPNKEGAKKKGHKTLLEVKRDSMGNAYVSKASKGVQSVQLQQSRGKKPALRIDIQSKDLTSGYRRIGTKVQNYKGRKPAMSEEEKKLRRKIKAEQKKEAKRLGVTLLPAGFTI
jgi:uncharacterized protein (DUF3084 family)